MAIKTAFLMLLFSLVLGHVVGGSKGRSLLKCGDPANSAPQNIFNISRDTIYVNIEGKMSAALLIHDKYYAFYEIRDPSSTSLIKKFYIISKSGKIEKEIQVPEGIKNEYYYNLYYWKNRFIVNTVFYKNTYSLDESKGEFVKDAQAINYPVFEDENYRITSECHGEFGSTIYFKNKHSGMTYSGSLDCPALINKLGKFYYVNAGADIIEIEDPANKIAVTPNALPNKELTLNTRPIFKNYNMDGNFGIATSFIANDVLYHIYNTYHNELDIFSKKDQTYITKDTVKIGVINEGKFKSLLTFKDRIDIQFQQQLSPDSQICTFHTEERVTRGYKKDIPPYVEGKYGFIEIVGNDIKLHYFISKRFKARKN